MCCSFVIFCNAAVSYVVDLVWGLVWYGMVWYGMVWYGMVLNSITMVWF